MISGSSNLGNTVNNLSGRLQRRSSDWSAGDTRIYAEAGCVKRLTLTSAPSSDIVPVGIIAGSTVGSTILLLMLLLALGFFLYRQRKGSEYTQRSSIYTASLPSALPFHQDQHMPTTQPLIRMGLMNIHITWP